MSWVRYATASVRYVFVSAAEEAQQAQTIELSNRVPAFLQERGKATRSEISAECSRGRVPKGQIDASLNHLLTFTSSKICVQWVKRPVDAPGAPTRIHRLA
ncbi:hypothetical protein LP417_22175 [Polaromonas sp. P1-6]|nr:hypothetical protein LP417_22175 [Polaromonas sp. P1-6]